MLIFTKSLVGGSKRVRNMLIFIQHCSTLGGDDKTLHSLLKMDVVHTKEKQPDMSSLIGYRSALL
jgi:hypothetical protein